jgi:predicted acetyltransferase
MAELQLLDVRFRQSFLLAMTEFVDEGRAGDDTMVGSEIAEFGATWESDAGFATYVRELRAAADRPRKPGFVSCTTWWWTAGEEYVGRAAVRHQLTEHLLEVGGHIGYDVRRSRRGEGQATAMLRAVLPEANLLGIDPALITCDAANIASRRVIEANGGVLEDQRGLKMRYWVPTHRG